MSELFNNFSTLIIFLHLISAIIWIGGMIVIRFAVHYSMQSIEDPKIKLGRTLENLKRFFLNLCKEFKSSVILVTHDLSEAIYLSNRILFFGKNPAKIIYEYKNENNQEFDMEKIDEIKNRLFKTYPKILEGEI
ncbi:MAG: hypothetical protein IE890_06140 [Arcobacter sp.]|nr:hypothetical protein [Arcobacter sp.]